MPYMISASLFFSQPIKWGERSYRFELKFIGEGNEGFMN